MAALAAFIGNLLGSLTAWLGAYFTKRTANYVALVALTASAAAFMWAAATALFAGLAMAMPTALLIPMTWFIPGNFDECLASIFTAEVICAGYRWHRDTVRASAAA